MATADEWKALGALVTKRRESRSLSGRAAERAGGPSEPTWRRIEDGQKVDAQSLYRICTTLLLEDEEAKSWFEMVGFDFDQTGYQRPEALDQLTAALEKIKRGAEEGLAAAARLEAESRRPQ